jgi:hypothetical protein
MLARSYLPGYRWFQFFHNVSIRTGVYIGVCLSLVFLAWLVIANHVPFLERFALERNIAAAAVLLFLSAVPVLRFIRAPGNLLASSLLAWLIFSLCYRVLCLIFHALGDKLSTFHLFMLGAVTYMILTTLSWIGTCIWKVRAAHVSHSNHHVS